MILLQNNCKSVQIRVLAGEKLLSELAMACQVNCAGLTNQTASQHVENETVSCRTAPAKQS